MNAFAAAVFLPLIGAFIAGLFGRWIGDRGAQLVTCGAMILSAAIAWWMLYEVLSAALGWWMPYAVAWQGQVVTVDLLRWIESGDFELSWALRFDQLSAVMVFVVSTMSAAIHVYSIGYMAHDRSIPRFFAYLSLFTFFMLALVTADNFLQLYFGWEGVGLCSYFLIGFWYHKPSANAAAIKAFVVNRVGDFGFALGILGVFLVYDSVMYDTVFQAAAADPERGFRFLDWDVHALTALCLLLFMGAMGKSAQLGLHTWLPDAMEGPTPVSALIHAATMVTAGVFMVVRLSPMFEYAPVALAVVAVIGASTAFFAATIGLCQTDIKRVIAYSTISQLGYMFFAAGVSAYGAAIFHLMTHAFFKALLFLGAGSVIHAMSDEQDMRNMGGIRRMLPITYPVMWVGSLALAGIGLPVVDVGFSGFHSKDVILESAFAAGSGVGFYAFWLGIAAAALTAFYSWRLLILTFHGTPRADETTMARVQESPKVMTIPLIFLALGATVSGYLGYRYFVGPDQAKFWGDSILVLADNAVPAAAHEASAWVKSLPLAMALGGIALAYLVYQFRPGLADALAARFRGLYLFILNKWYFDELYDAVFVRPAFYIGRGFWKAGDGAVIDGVGPDGVAAAALDLAGRVSRIQTGYVYHYAFAMLIGVVLFVTWYLYSFPL